MRRVLPVVLLGFLIVGCEAAAPGAGAPIGAGPAAASAQLRVGFGGLVDTIEVGATERLPLRAAALIGPDGAVTAATFVIVDAMPQIATGQWAVTPRWGDPATGGNAHAALATPPGGGTLQARQQLLAMVSRAEITLPDPVAYRRDWQRYRIRLTFGTPPGEVETIEIAAPAPLPR